jgi:thioredoxin-related protein
MNLPTLLLTLILAVPYVPVTNYDPARDADKDIRDAVAEAQRTGKRIILEVGGEWCKWCHIMDAYFDAHPELTKLRDTNYITVKINFSDENENKDILSRYPKIAGYPHIFVLEKDGKLLHSQNTAELEKGESYELPKFTEFLARWVPKKQ